MCLAESERDQWRGILDEIAEVLHPNCVYNSNEFPAQIAALKKEADEMRNWGSERAILQARVAELESEVEVSNLHIRNLLNVGKMQIRELRAEVERLQAEVPYAGDNETFLAWGVWGPDGKRRGLYGLQSVAQKGAQACGGSWGAVYEMPAQKSSPVADAPSQERATGCNAAHPAIVADIVASQNALTAIRWALADLGIHVKQDPEATSSAVELLCVQLRREGRAWTGESLGALTSPAMMQAEDNAALRQRVFEHIGALILSEKAGWGGLPDLVAQFDLLGRDL